MVKKASKAAAAEKPAKEKKPKGPKKAKVRDGKGLIAFFMGALIQAGCVQEVPKTAGEQKDVAQALRQFAERLARQTRKFEDDGGIGAQTPDDDEDSD